MKIALFLLALAADPTPATRIEGAIRSIRAADSSVVLLTERGVFRFAPDARRGARAAERIEGLPEEPVAAWLDDAAAFAGGDLWALRGGRWTYLGDLRTPVYGGIRQGGEVLLATQVGLLAISETSWAVLPARRPPSRSGSVVGMLIGLGASRVPGEPVERSAFRTALPGAVVAIEAEEGRAVATVLDGARHVRADAGPFRAETEALACPTEGLPGTVQRLRATRGRCLALLVDGSMHLRKGSEASWRRILSPQAFGKGDRIAAFLETESGSVWIGTRGGKLFLLSLDSLGIDG